MLGNALGCYLIIEVKRSLTALQSPADLGTFFHALQSLLYDAASAADLLGQAEEHLATKVERHSILGLFLRDCVAAYAGMPFEVGPSCLAGTLCYLLCQPCLFSALPCIHYSPLLSRLLAATFLLTSTAHRLFGADPVADRQRQGSECLSLQERCEVLKSSSAYASEGDSQPSESSLTHLEQVASPPSTSSAFQDVERQVGAPYTAILSHQST